MRCVGAGPVSRARWLIVCLGLCLVTSLAQADPKGGEAASELRRAPTSGGSYEVEIRSEGPIPLNEVFSVEFAIFDADSPDEEIPGARLTVGTWMPAHQHGGSLEPVVVYHPGGGGRIEGLLFFMEGLWQLRLGVMSEGKMERVEFDFDMAP